MIDVTKLNRENLLRLAAAVEAEPQGSSEADEPGFDMHVWDTFAIVNGKPCGAIHCIGGLADVIFGNHEAYAVNKPLDAFTTPMALAFDALYFPEDDGIDEDDPKNPWNASPKQAAAVIRHFAETGEVDWTRVMEADA